MAEKIRVTVVIEYTPLLGDYPDCATAAEAAAFDERENPFLAYPDAYLDDTVSVTYEAVAID
ncbi:hypothetical protein ACWEVY_28490 [Streptomyces longwoodensis]